MTTTAQASGSSANYDAVPNKDEPYDVELGEVVFADTNIGLSASTSQKMLHIGFIRKVYGILTCQLFLTAGISYLCTLGDRTAFINAYPYVHLPLFIANMVLLGAVYAFRKRSPLNLLLLGIWTGVMAVTMGFITAVYVEAGESNLLFEAVGITGAAFVSLTIFTFQSKIDFSFMGAGLYVGLNLLIMFSFLSLLVGVSLPLLYSVAGTVLFSAYIIFDTSRLIKDFQPDEYINASIQLYLDILNLFLYILRILGKKK